jgi:excinuclease UvrABC helicase subunit UvrB
MEIDPKLENLALKILNKAQIKNENYGIDPITIIIIIGVTLSLIRVIQECRKKRKHLNRYNDALDLRHTIVNLSVSDNWLNNYRINKILKQHLSKQQYLNHGAALKKAIMEVGQNLSDEESLTLLEASNV